VEVFNRRKDSFPCSTASWYLGFRLFECDGPIAEQARSDVRQLERLLQQWIVLEINLSDGEIVRRAPIGVYLAQRFRIQGLEPSFVFMAVFVQARIIVKLILKRLSALRAWG
jgi:hypothetical protein